LGILGKVGKMDFGIKKVFGICYKKNNDVDNIREKKMDLLNTALSFDGTDKNGLLYFGRILLNIMNFIDNFEEADKKFKNENDQPDSDISDECQEFYDEFFEKFVKNGYNLKETSLRIMNIASGLLANTFKILSDSQLDSTDMIMLFGRLNDSIERSIQEIAHDQSFNEFQSSIDVMLEGLSTGSRPSLTGTYDFGLMRYISGMNDNIEDENDDDD
jgi:hypothetical protein